MEEVTRNAICVNVLKNEKKETQYNKNKQHTIVYQKKVTQQFCFVTAGIKCSQKVGKN